jgi:hypothetical protein
MKFHHHCVAVFVELLDTILKFVLTVTKFNALHVDSWDIEFVYVLSNVQYVTKRVILLTHVRKYVLRAARRVIIFAVAHLSVYIVQRKGIWQKIAHLHQLSVVDVVSRAMPFAVAHLHQLSVVDVVSRAIY